VLVAKTDRLLLTLLTSRHPFRTARL